MCLLRFWMIRYNATIKITDLDYMYILREERLDIFSRKSCPDHLLHKIL